MVLQLRRMKVEMPPAPRCTELIVSPEVFDQIKSDGRAIGVIGGHNVVGGMRLHIARSYAHVVSLAGELKQRGVKVGMCGKWDDEPTPTEGQDDE